MTELDATTAFYSLDLQEQELRRMLALYQGFCRDGVIAWKESRHGFARVMWLVKLCRTFFPI